MLGKKIVLPLALLVFLAPFAFAYTLTGTVTDDCDVTTIDGVTVTLGEVDSALTNSSGEYSIAGASNGSATVYWHKAGYKESNAGITVVNDTEYNITIEKSYCASYGSTDVGTSAIDAIVGIIVILASVGAVIGIVIVFKYAKGGKIM